eukprot:408820_1
MNVKSITSIGVCGAALYFLKQYIDTKNQSERLKGVQYVFEKRKALSSVDIAKGVYGRISFFTKEDTKDKNGNAYWLAPYAMPCAWIIESRGLYELSKCESDYDKLLKLGWSNEWIQQQLKKFKKCHFNLYLFLEKSSNYKVYWATWDGIFDFLRDNEYEIFTKIEQFKPDLKQITWDKIEKQSDFSFTDVDNKWQNDARFLTKEKFLSIAEKDLTIVQVRFFLYCYMCLSRLFYGDGYTRDKDGKIGCKEYIVRNLRLSDIPEMKIVELKMIEEKKAKL